MLRSFGQFDPLGSAFYFKRIFCFADLCRRSPRERVDRDTIPTFFSLTVWHDVVIAWTMATMQMPGEVEKPGFFRKNQLRRRAHQHADQLGKPECIDTPLP